MSEPESTNTMFHNAFDKISDGIYSLRTSAQSGGANQNVNIASSTVSTSGPNAETGFGSGTILSPGANVAIASYMPLPANTGKLHRIDVTVWLSGGTPAIGDSFNVGFKFGTTLVSKVPLIAALNIPVSSAFYFKATTGIFFSINSINAGTSGVTYNAYIQATRVVD